MSDFKYYHHVENFLPEDAVSLLAQYFKNKTESNFWQKSDLKEGASQLSQYGDPLIEIILAEQLKQVAEITGKNLGPTYSFSRLYQTPECLTAHTDRPSCEYSVTVHVAHMGEKWPFWVKAPESKPECFVLNPGDAVVYKGCEVLHWRSPMVQHNCQANAQFMLHYVDMDGPYASYLYDERNDLGQASVR